jgi:hypothetical protein
MADSIKVQALHKLEEVLKGIPELGSVHRWQGKPTDLDQVKLPALFFWDEEETRGKRNRLALGTIKMNLAVFIRLTPAGASSFDDTCNNLQGKIHNALVQTSSFKGLVENLEEGNIWKDFPNDQYGVLYMSFQLTYGHVWGDAFSVAY